MIVLDASALVDVLVSTERAAWVLDVLNDEAIIAPAHQPAEVLSATGRLMRAGQLDEEAWHAALVELDAFSQEPILPTLAHLEQARLLAPRVRLLDGLYVALAQERSCSLVTTDARLARADVPCHVLTPHTP